MPGVASEQPLFAWRYGFRCSDGARVLRRGEAKPGVSKAAIPRLGAPACDGILGRMELRVVPNKHGYLVTGRVTGQNTEEQAVFRTMQDLDHAMRAAGVDADTISRMDRRLERGDGFKVEERQVAAEHLFPQHRRA